MTDIRMDLTWDIEPGGDIEFSVSPHGSDDALASFILTEEEIAESLSEDLSEFDWTLDYSILDDWDNLAKRLRYYADAIDKLVDDARLGVLVKAHLFDGEDYEG